MCIVNIKVNEEKPHDMTVEDLYTMTDIVQIQDLSMIQFCDRLSQLLT